MDLQNIIIHALKEVLEVHGIKAEVDENTIIYGKKGLLDSLGLVSFIICLEDWIHQKKNVDIDIVSDESFSRFHNPFYNVKSVVKFVEEILNDNK